MKDLHIRQMSAGDIPAVREIERECFLSAWSVEGYTNELLKDDSQALIAEMNDEIIGFAITRLITSAGEAEILNIAVSEKLQNQGIGTLLWKEIDGFLKSNAVRSVWLEVRKSNFTAQAFYRRNGFAVCGERKNFYTTPTEDALVMKLNL